MLLNLLFIIFSLTSAIVNGYYPTLTPERNNSAIIWCTTGLAEQAKCDTFGRALKAVAIATGSKEEEQLLCKMAVDKEQCLDRLDNREADLTELDPGEVFVAGRYHSLVPIMAERYGRDDGYYAISVVHANVENSVNSIRSLFDLRDKRACFPGVGQLAGWVMPLVTLMEKLVLNVTDCNNLVKSAAAFFGPSCAPGSLINKYNPSGDNPQKMCDLCRGSKGQRCSSSDPYAGFQGAFTCLYEGTGQVAFLKHDTIQRVTNQLWYRGPSPAEFRLLCPTGQTASLSDYRNCNWGFVPAHAIVTSSAAEMTRRKQLQNFLKKSSNAFGEGVVSPNDPYDTSRDNIAAPESGGSWNDAHSNQNTNPRGYDPYSSTTYNPWGRDNRNTTNWNNNNRENRNWDDRNRNLDNRDSTGRNWDSNRDSNTRNWDNTNRDNTNRDWDNRNNWDNANNRDNNWDNRNSNNNRTSSTDAWGRPIDPWNRDNRTSWNNNNRSSTTDVWGRPTDPWNRDNRTGWNNTSTSPYPSWSSTSSTTTTPLPPSLFRLFDSSPYGKNTDLMFLDATTNLVEIDASRQTFKGYLGEYSDLIRRQRKCPSLPARLCVVSDKEYEKCLKMRVAFKAQMLMPNLHCLKSDSQIGCMSLIKDNAADLTLLDAGDIYKGGQMYDLMPIISEQYDLDDSYYYVVAVAKQPDKETDLLYLKGKKSCHSAIGTAAGWIVPMGFLLSSERMRSYGCNAVKAASEFFQKSCIPGVLSREYTYGHWGYDNLCDLCHGSSSHYCARDSQEPFYGHAGALRCIVEGGGDIAFVKHTTILENTAGKNPAWWSRPMMPDDYELLCRDGTRATHDKYAECNLGRVAANAIVTSRYRTPENVASYIDLFMYSQQFYGSKFSEDFTFKMFVSEGDYHDLIFQDATQQLKVVPLHKRDYRVYLGPHFVQAVRLVDCTAGGEGLYALVTLVAVGVAVATRY